MPQSLTYHRVEDDGGPSFSVVDNFDTAGWTITLRATKASGLKYTRAAVIDVVGDPGLGILAEYHFPFVAGDLDDGDQSFDLHYSHATLEDHSVPADFKMTLRVRAK